MTGSIKPNSCQIIGVSGGSGSGKTYFAKALQKRLGADLCQIVYQDDFYFDQSKKFDFEGGSVNFDHPDSIDFELLQSCLALLKQGRTASIPIYDFVTHSRKKETVQLTPKPMILVDGILIFHPEPLRKLFDHRIYFDTAEDLRFERRFKRDVEERGRTPEGVRHQFYKQVKPMHDLFVEPSKIHAQTQVSDPAEFQQALDQVCGLCKVR